MHTKFDAIINVSKCWGTYGLIIMIVSNTENIMNVILICKFVFNLTKLKENCIIIYN